MENNSINKIQHTYNVSGLSCGGCANTVESRLLSSIPEIKSVKVDLQKKQVDIVSEINLKLSQIQGALKNTSYNITELENDN
tara:strand:- start:17930 stop:18175 length:246 start_codon:yes stop_codon:yes gene_type:complete